MEQAKLILRWEKIGLQRIQYVKEGGARKTSNLGSNMGGGVWNRKGEHSEWKDGEQKEWGGGGTIQMERYGN